MANALDLNLLTGFGRSLDIETGAVLTWMVRDVPEIRMGVETLAGELMSTGLEFKANGKKQYLTHEFQKVVIRNWMPCGPRALSSYIAYGFIPVVIVQNEQGDPIPRVPDFEEYIIKQVVTKNRPQYLFYWRQTSTNGIINPENLFDDKPDPNVLLLFPWGEYPTPSGKYTSILNTLISDVTFMKRMMLYATVIEHKGAENPVYMMPRHSEFNERLSMNYGPYQSNGNGNGVTRDHSMIVRNPIPVSSQKGQPNLSWASFQNTPDVVIRLPENMEAVSHSRVAARSDLVPLREMMIQLVGAVLGVPASRLMSVGSRHSGDHDAEQQRYAATLRKYRSILDDFFTSSYHMCYRQDDELYYKRLISSYIPRSPMTPEQLFAKVKQARDISVTVPVIPSATEEKLYQSYQHGIIPFDELEYDVRQLLGLSMDYIPKDKPFEIPLMEGGGVFGIGYQGNENQGSSREGKQKKRPKREISSDDETDDDRPRKAERRERSR